jgi:hypothetical protein
MTIFCPLHTMSQPTGICPGASTPWPCPNRLEQVEVEPSREIRTWNKDRRNKRA